MCFASWLPAANYIANWCRCCYWNSVSVSQNHSNTKQIENITFTIQQRSRWAMTWQHVTASEHVKTSLVSYTRYQSAVHGIHGMEKNIENILSRRLMPTIFSCFPQMPISFRPLSPECEYRSRKTWNLLQFRTVWFVFRYIILTKRYSYSYVQVMRCSSAPRQHVVIIITEIWVHIYLRAIVAGSYSGHTICQSYVEHAPA